MFYRKPGKGESLFSPWKRKDKNRGDFTQKGGKTKLSRQFLSISLREGEGGKKKRGKKRKDEEKKEGKEMDDCRGAGRTASSRSTKGGKKPGERGTEEGRGGKRIEAPLLPSEGKKKEKEKKIGKEEESPSQAGERGRRSRRVEGEERRRLHFLLRRKAGQKGKEKRCIS